MAAGPLRQVLNRIRTLVGEPAADDTSDGRLVQRFVSQGDERAFEQLLHRHGPMVLGVCRRLVRDAHLAEDAFQAVFLVLARKARTVQPRDRVGNWLYGVAVRVALKARTAAARRRERLQEVRDMPSSERTPDGTAGELRAVLDHEVERLPDKYREPFVLAYFQGKTNAEVARELGCPEGTVFGRLARARDRLRFRLERRGLALSAAALLASLTEPSLSAAVPAALAGATLKGVSLVAFGDGLVAEGVSASVSSLVQGALRDMLMRRLRWVLLVTVVIGLLGVGSAGALHFVRTPKVTAGEPIAAAAADHGPVPTGMIKTGNDIWGLAFSPDGKVLATSGADSPFKGGPATLRLWDVATGKVVREIPTPGPLQPLKFSADGKLLVGHHWGLHGFEVATGKKAFEPVKWTGIVEFALTADGKTAALPSDKGIRVVDLPSGKDVWTFDAHLEANDSFQSWPLAFSPDGKTLASGGAHRSFVPGGGLKSQLAPIRLWNLGTGKLDGELAGHARSLFYTADGKSLMAYGEAPAQGKTRAVGETMFVLWELATRQERRKVSLKDPFCISDDGRSPVEWRRDVAGTEQGELWVYVDITVNQDVRKVAAIDPGKLTSSVKHPLLYGKMAPNKKYLVFPGIEPRPGIAAHYERARFWDLTTGKEMGGPAN